MNSSAAEKHDRSLPHCPDRRRLLALLLIAATAAAPRRAWSEPNDPTPAQMLGPFYPPQPDTGAGNDLATVNGRERAAGAPLRVAGRVTDTHGRAQPEVLVEIWQTNAHGRYHHPRDDSPAPRDPNFRGYGRATTDRDGAYDFRTVMPVAYPGRTPHIHFKLSRGGRTLLVTQMYLPGDAGRDNERDGVFRSVANPAARARLIGVPMPASGGEALRFDIVIADDARR